MDATDVKAKFRIPHFVSSLIMGSLHKEELKQEPTDSMSSNTSLCSLCFLLCGIE